MIKNKKSFFAIVSILILSLWTGNIYALNTNETPLAQDYMEDAEHNYLGVAGNFNVFTLEDLTLHNTDSEGRVAVGGNADLSNFGVGANLPLSQDRYDLIVNGNVSINGGENQAGNTLLSVNSALNLFNFGHKNNNARNPYKHNTEGFFKKAELELYQKTAEVSALSETGTVSMEYGGLHLRGAEEKVNVFRVDSEMLGCSNGIHINVPEGSTTIINVFGENVSFPSCEIFYNNNSGGAINSKAQTILWNMPEAKTITANRMSILGTVLAPYAHSTLQNGHINGSLIVKSHEGEYESHLYLFNPPHFIENDDVKVDINVEKIWVDDENRLNTRPNNIIIRLLENGRDTQKSLTLNKDNTWSGSFIDLDKYDAFGKLIIYTISEEPVEGYEMLVEGSSEAGYRITNTLDPVPTETVNVTVKKDWDDDDNLLNIRPKEVSFTLFSNGKNTEKTLVLNKSNDWSGSFNDLDKYDSSHKLIEYTIQEEVLEDYISHIEKKWGLQFPCNKLNPRVTSSTKYKGAKSMG